MNDQRRTTCAIEQVGKQRNGRPRFWCSVHGASATGRYGVRLPACEAAYRDVANRNVLRLDASDFPGGIALWGAVAPAYDTTNLPPDLGIHVHAREASDGDKQIDATFDAVAVSYPRDLVTRGSALITRETAINYYISRFLKRDIRHLFCTHCGELHLDADYFAVKAHRQHLCHACGHYFRDDRRAVSNPIVFLREACGLPATPPDPVRPDRPLNLRQADYSGGIQIWASNPALVWTAERPEDEGLHVHAFDDAGGIEIDETFSRVVVDGILLDEAQVQHFMAQSALDYLRNKVVSLKCPTCNAPHFDRSDLGFIPHIDHDCETCGVTFRNPGSRRMVVSNPFAETRIRLASLSPIKSRVSKAARSA
jgi:hypothetical protein